MMFLNGVGERFMILTKSKVKICTECYTSIKKSKHRKDHETYKNIHCSSLQIDFFCFFYINKLFLLSTHLIFQPNIYYKGKKMNKTKNESWGSRW